MTTARDLITMSLRTLSVLHVGETPAAEDADDALDTLNQMVNSWINNGLDMEWVTMTSLDDTVPYPDDHIGPLRHNLAMHLSPDYGVSPSMTVAALAQSGYEMLRKRYLVNRELVIDSPLTRSTETSVLV